MRVLVKTFWPAFCLIHSGLKLWKTLFSFGERNLRAQCKSRDSTNDGSTWRFLLVARLAATTGLWRAIPRGGGGGELPFLKGFSLWTDQSERVYFYWPPGPNPVVTMSTRVGPSSRLDVLRASRRLDRGSKQSRRSFFFRFQEAERPTYIGGTPKIALDRLCLKEAALCLFSQIHLVLSGFAHHNGDLGLSNFGAFLVKTHPSTSGTRMKVEYPDTDPQRFCL